jgi:hypothetical protein
MLQSGQKDGFAASTHVSLDPPWYSVTSLVDANNLGMADLDPRTRCDSLHPAENALGDFDPDAILTVAPKGRFKLGYGCIMGIVINGMIGSGIFENAGNFYAAIDSTGVALMLWLAGLIYTVAGVIVLIEYGLSVPRRTIGNRDVALPRSGGMLNYVGFFEYCVMFANRFVAPVCVSMACVSQRHGPICDRILWHPVHHLWQRSRQCLELCH